MCLARCRFLIYGLTCFAGCISHRVPTSATATATPAPRREPEPPTRDAEVSEKSEGEPPCPPIEGCTPREVFTASNLSYVLRDPEALSTQDEERIQSFVEDYRNICGGVIVRVIGYRGVGEGGGG